MMLRLVTVVGLLAGVSAAMAAPVRMSGEEIKRAMPGALLEIDTPLRMTIPVKVGTNGLMSAEAGALGLTLGATKDRGRWWTEGDKLCMKWFRWFDAKPRCMALRREGNRVHWSEASGESGTATITEAKPVVAAVTAKPKQAPARPVAPVAEKQPIAPPQQTAAAPAPQPEPKQPAPTTIAAGDANNQEEIVVASADVPAARNGYEPVEPAVPPRFTTAALGEWLKSALTPKEPEPYRLGMNAEASASDAVEGSPEMPQILNSEAAQQNAARQRVASAANVTRPYDDIADTESEPAAAPEVRRQQPATDTRQASNRRLASFRVSNVQIGDRLNVRTGPSEYHPRIGAIGPDGRGVRIVGACRNLWCPVQYGRLKGWVNRYYLAEERPTQGAWNTP
ncbi:hypothetical protein APY04_0315 [Hyphomicrobium sulfonivorans]|uniref:SH3b domain-containing protein n=2 Tax=Hyphomicrobium sulfonivorans TaxID=121290 RepID=A0A109BPY0_HYPSL|nr:hypothetical protein APY04_0315 [Hyphomicrobium sulfonivorans]